MTHPENMTALGRFMRQTIAIQRQSFILAESITDEALARHKIVGDSRESYLANIPSLAGQFANTFTQVVNMTTQASQRELDRVYDGADEVLRELTALNKERIS